MTNTIQDEMRRELVRYLVAKAIFCPIKGHVLDVRTCVIINNRAGMPAVVISPEAWDFYNQDSRDAITERGFTVTDPRTAVHA